MFYLLSLIFIYAYCSQCDAINNSGICPGFTLVDIPNRIDENGIDLRPDWALYRDARPERRFDFGNMEFYGEGKVGRVADAFSDTDEWSKMNPSTNLNVSTRNQIISYATRLHSLQHRCFSFSFLICGQYARLFRWDRTVCIASVSFNFHEEPQTLASFFWSYAHLSDSERGYDETAKCTSPEEIERFADAIPLSRRNRNNLRRQFALGDVRSLRQINLLSRIIAIRHVQRPKPTSLAQARRGTLRPSNESLQPWLRGTVDINAKHKSARITKTTDKGYRKPPSNLTL